MDIGTSCKESYGTLKQYPGLLLPLLLFGLVSFVAALGALSGSPLRAALIEYQSLGAEYDAAHPLDTSLSFAQSAQAQQEHADGRSAYIEEHRSSVFAAIDVQNLLIRGAVSLVLWILAWFYVMTALFIAVKDIQQGHGLHWPGVLGETTRRFIPSIFGWVLIPLLVMVVPAALLVALMVLAFEVHPILGALVFILGLIGLVVWTIFVLVKLTLVSGTFFLDGKGVFSATRESWQKSKGKFLHVGLLLVVFAGISMVPGQLTGGAFVKSFLLYLTQAGSVALIVTCVLGVLNAFVYALANAYATLVFCHAYRNLTTEKK